ncbi:unnamed protein product, partial [Mesorhabditis belari]|uniref:Uncharacterized protein n=1 Tax=Mesorhabditis belari TaxID=2138241 RepID=A0AAF3EBG5_9BILA
MRDRFCYKAIDAFAIACANESPPLQLIPFCFGYKYQCSRLTYPTEDWCEKEFDHYERTGTRTAEWCQRFELFCNATAREEKRAELNALMGDAVKVHKQCVELWGLSHAICNPFIRNFQWERCQKFLFDCELISDFPDDEEKTESILSTSQVLTKDELNRQILEAAIDTNTSKTSTVDRNRVNLGREKEKEKIVEKPEQSQQIPMAEQRIGEQPIHTDVSNVPEFFVGQAKKQGNRIVINPVKVEPGEVIDRLVSPPPAPTPSASPSEVNIRPSNIDFRPEELLRLATDVGEGKLKPVLKRSSPLLIDESSPEWITKFQQ